MFTGMRILMSKLKYKRNLGKSVPNFFLYNHSIFSVKVCNGPQCTTLSFDINTSCILHNIILCYFTIEKIWFEVFSSLLHSQKF